MKHTIFISLILCLLLTFGLGAQVAAFNYVFHVPFADSGDPGKDVSGNGNHATIAGDAQWVATDGGALECSGTNGHAAVEVDVPESDFTMGIWIKTETPDVGIMSVLDGDAGAGGHDRHFFLVGSVLNFRTWQGGAWPSSAEVADGEWHHIALVVESGVGQTAYVDGVEVGTNAYDHSDFDWQNLVWIGFSNDAASDYFNGLIRNAVYIDEPLTVDQVNELYVGQSTAVESKGKVSTTWGDLKID